MYVEQVKRRRAVQWYIEPFGKMRVPVIIYADEQSIKQMDENVYRQAANVASLPGIVKASYVMPDGHWGYGFPIGGVAAFDPEQGGVISAGGVGFDISCGVRSVRTALTLDDIKGAEQRLAGLLAENIPAGVGSTGKLKLSPKQMDQMLLGGAQWAVDQGYGTKEDLAHTEQGGQWPGQNQNMSPTAQKSDRKTRLERLVREITTSKCRKSPKYTMPPSPRSLVWESMT